MDRTHLHLARVGAGLLFVAVLLLGIVALHEADKDGYARGLREGQKWDAALIREGVDLRRQLIACRDPGTLFPTTTWVAPGRSATATMAMICTDGAETWPARAEYTCDLKDRPMPIGGK